MDTMARAKLVGAAAAEGVLPVPGYMEYLVNVGSTPAQRFWSVPALCASSARSTALAPLLKQVYPEGLGPLADKLDQLLERAAAAAGQGEPFSRIRANSPSPLASPAHHQQPPPAGRPSTTAERTRKSAGEQLAAKLDAIVAPSGAGVGPRPTTAPVPAPARASTGALIAAGLQWERGQETSRIPALRQNLTYDEIARLRAEALR